MANQKLRPISAQVNVNPPKKKKKKKKPKY